MKSTCLVLGKTGVGKSTLINAISENQCNLKTNNSGSAVTIEAELAEFTKDNYIYRFIDTPGLRDAKGDETNLNELKKAVSEFKDFKYILILLNFHDDRIDRDVINMLEDYMKIFPLQYFWEHVIIVYTKVFSDGQYPIEVLINNKKGAFVKNIKNVKDYEYFRKFMKNKGIDFPDKVEEFFVNSFSKYSSIKDDTKNEYQKILNLLKTGKPMFKDIKHSDREQKIETGGKLKKIQTLRTITYVPRYGNNLSLPEFILPPEKDDINITPYHTEYIEENTNQVKSIKCKKYYIIKVYKIDYYKVNGETIIGNKNFYNEKLKKK